MMRKFKLVICETSNHQHLRYTESIYQLLSYSDELELILILRSEDLEKFGNSINGASLIVIGSTFLDVKETIDKVEKDLKPDLWIFPTLEPVSIYNISLLFLIRKKLFKYKKILGIHNGKYIFDSKWKQLLYIFTEARNFYFLKKNTISFLFNLLFGDFWTDNKTHLLFISEDIRQNVKQVAKVNSLVIPTDFYSENNVNETKIDDDVLRIVIPGIVDSSRRDYLGFFRGLMDSKLDSQKFEFTLLGKFEHTKENAELEGMIKSLVSKGYRVKTYGNSYVTNEEFESVINACHFVFVLNPKVSYGKYKESAGFSLITKFAKPGILHSSDANKNKSALIYDDFEDLFKSLRSIDAFNYKEFVKKQLIQSLKSEPRKILDSEVFPILNANTELIS